MNWNLIKIWISIIIVGIVGGVIIWNLSNVTPNINNNQENNSKIINGSGTFKINSVKDSTFEFNADKFIVNYNESNIIWEDSSLLNFESTDILIFTEGNKSYRYVKEYTQNKDALGQKSEQESET